MGQASPDPSPPLPINLEMGDPSMFEEYWREEGGEGAVVIRSWEKMSYFSRGGEGPCWFMEGALQEQIARLHGVVGNARVQGKHLVVGVGSTQLFQAALFAISSTHDAQPLPVVSAAPFYSFYAEHVDYLRSGLYRWAGDARTFKEDGPFIEVICMPNNPDGFMNQAVLSEDKGHRIYDLAYYWPQYAPITYEANHDIMLFTFSKLTGHAGTRIGWALVKDEDVARKMTKFITLNTLGVSKDSQLRAAMIMTSIADSYETQNTLGRERFFDSARLLMTERWRRLREAVTKSSSFVLPKFPSPNCRFSGEKSEPHPAFAWLKCERPDVDDCESFLKSLGIVSRGGAHFGADRRYVRVSMLAEDEVFDCFIQRILAIR
ncbi:tryptophan aminotransferase-related protein 2-like isoform X3 [Wolffia australiana]